VSVAQLVELLVVVQVVAGSSPVAHPKIACKLCVLPWLRYSRSRSEAPKSRE
jgi:hypothetical protein